jgi:hypothetical protein
MDKNDRKYGQFASVPQLIETYGEWVQSLFDDGFRMYLVTFKFLITFQDQAIFGKMDKNDRKYEQFASVLHLINSYGEWVQSLFDDGFRMYLVTFKFNHIPGAGLIPAVG